METDEQLNAHATALSRVTRRARVYSSAKIREALEKAWGAARKEFVSGETTIRCEPPPALRDGDDFFTPRGNRMIMLYIRNRALKDAELREKHGLVDVHVFWDDEDGGMLYFRCKDANGSRHAEQLVRRLAKSVLDADVRCSARKIDPDEFELLCDPAVMQALSKATGGLQFYAKMGESGDDAYLMWDARDPGVPEPAASAWDKAE